MPDEQFERLCIEEYKALRAESLRCGGIISNTIWVGVTQYALTCISVLALKTNFYIPLLITLLMLESIAATAMFLSEVFKYSRIGRYLRHKVEESFARKDSMTLTFKRPMEWEHWIEDKRSSFFYATSLFVLQIPIIAFLPLLFISKNISLVEIITNSSNQITNIILMILIYMLLAVDMAMVTIMSIRIVLENKKALNV